VRQDVFPQEFLISDNGSKMVRLRCILARNSTGVAVGSRLRHSGQHGAHPSLAVSNARLQRLNNVLSHGYVRYHVKCKVDRTRNRS
jgi:hypothetical protein